ncbi:hypothetical protein BDN70DRAFT_877370, partial [Pholiota conissans]
MTPTLPRFAHAYPYYPIPSNAPLLPARFPSPRHHHFLLSDAVTISADEKFARIAKLTTPTEDTYVFRGNWPVGFAASAQQG